MLMGWLGDARLPYRPSLASWAWEAAKCVSLRHNANTSTPWTWPCFLVISCQLCQWPSSLTKLLWEPNKLKTYRCPLCYIRGFGFAPSIYCFSQVNSTWQPYWRQINLQVSCDAINETQGVNRLALFHQLGSDNITSVTMTTQGPLKMIFIGPEPLMQ